MFVEKCIYHLSIYVSLVALDIYAQINDCKKNVATAWFSMVVIVNEYGYFSIKSRNSW